MEGNGTVTLLEKKARLSIGSMANEEACAKTHVLINCLNPNNLLEPESLLIRIRQSNDDHDCDKTMAVVIMTLEIMIIITINNSYYCCQFSCNFHTPSNLRPMKIVREHLLIHKKYLTTKCP